MQLNIVNNPTKTITINKSYDFIMKRLKYIGGWSNKSKGIIIVEASIDENLNMYKFKSKTNYGIFKTVEGNMGNVTVNSINENSCLLTIEMGKIFGSITDEVEMADINEQMQSFLNLLSELISMPDEELPNYANAAQLINADTEVKKEKLTFKDVVIAIAVIGVMLLWIFV